MTTSRMTIRRMSMGLAFFASFSLFACSLPKIHPNVTILPPYDTNRQVIESVNRHCEAWEADFHRKTDPIEIEVMTGTFQCGLVDSIGCTDGRRIKVTAHYSSAQYGLPALYHELCHRNRVSEAFWNDNTHQDDRWEMWTQRGYDLAGVE